MNRPFVWIALAYILGIVTARFLGIPTFYAWCGVVGFLLLSGLCLLIERQPLSNRTGIPNNQKDGYPQSEVNTNSLLEDNLLSDSDFSGQSQVQGRAFCRDIFSLLPILLSIFCTGILTYRIHSHIAPDNIANFIGTQKTEVMLRGVVVGAPESKLCPGGRLRTTLTLDLRRVRFDRDEDVIGDKSKWSTVDKGKWKEKNNEDRGEGLWWKVSGRVMVYIYGINDYMPDQYPYQYGDDLVLKARIRQPKGPSNPGQFDYRAYLERRGIDAVAVVKDPLDVILIGRKNWNPIWGPILGWIYGLKHKMELVIEKTLPSPEKGLLKAMLLGQRQGISEEIKDKFIQTGTVHILAISGLHTGLVALVILFILKLLRLPRKLRYGLTIGLLVAFSFLTGLKPPVVRASIMASLIMGAVLLDREADIYNCLGLAALMVLMVNSRLLFDAGFQLSFVAVLSIVYLCPWVEHRVFGLIAGWIQSRMAQRTESVKLELTESKTLNLTLQIWKYFIRLFSASMAAWIGTMPLVWYYFNVISPVALLANIFCVPLLFLTVACGLVLLLTGLFWLKLAAFFWAGVCWLGLRLLIGLSSIFSTWPFGHFYLGPPSFYFVLIYYILLGLVKIVTAEKSPTKAFGSIAGILVMINLTIWLPLLKKPSGELEITFLDVGHGDSVFIKFPYGGNMLVDTGSGPPYDMGRWVVQPFLLYKDVRRLDSLVLTHFDYDHTGGAGTILDNFNIGYVFGPARVISNYTNNNSNNRLYLYGRKLVKKADIRLVGLKDNMCISGYPGPVKIEVLNPAPQMMARFSSDDNNNSVVLKITYGQIDILLCGDIREEAMARLLNLGKNLQSEILKVPHHGGSLGPAGRMFLEQVQPSIAIISEAQDNCWGLPDQSTVDLLLNMGSLVFQTGVSGAITVTTDGYHIRLDTFLPGSFLY